MRKRTVAFNVQTVFMSAVDKWFGAGLDRRTKSYGLAVWRVGSRLASAYIGRKRSAWHFNVRQWRANTSQLRKEILVTPNNSLCRCRVRQRGESAFLWLTGRSEKYRSLLPLRRGRCEMKRYWGCRPNESRSLRGCFTMQRVPVFSKRLPSYRSIIRPARSGHYLRDIPRKYSSWHRQGIRFRYLN
jgi:hypothetical protein